MAAKEELITAAAPVFFRMFNRKTAAKTIKIISSDFPIPAREKAKISRIFMCQVKKAAMAVLNQEIGNA